MIILAYYRCCIHQDETDHVIIPLDVLNNGTVNIMCIVLQIAHSVGNFSLRPYILKNNFQCCVIILLVCNS